MGELTIPHERLLAVLERRLHAATSELAMKDAAIEHLREELAAAKGVHAKAGAVAELPAAG
jgi:regulator of PEP synthase PpsR (kinase-PPPase family)